MAKKKQERVAGGGGGSGLAGYEYQIDVSIWVALDLVLANRISDELILEPDTHEDIEADLKEDELGRVTGTVALDGYRLVVQAKLRTGDAWTVEGVKQLLHHGQARMSAAARLADQGVRYLLVTSAALNGGTQKLGVRRPGTWRQASEMPASISKALPAGAAGRVAIVGNQDHERLNTDIKTLLTEGFRVPNARWEACKQVLRDEARVRMSGAGHGRWGRAELEDVIRRHDGYIASSPELENYVEPKAWPALVAAMQKRHAALLVGQSGTGKTLTSKRLFEELRKTKVARHEPMVRSTLRVLVELLVSLEHPDEGLPIAARMVAAMEKHPDFKVGLSSAVQERIDEWLRRQLQVDEEFEATLQLAATVGSAATNAAEAARFLLHRPENRGFGNMRQWTSTTHDDDWYARLRADQVVRAVIEKYIKQVLPKERSLFRKDFVIEVERLAPGLTVAFQSAALEAMGLDDTLAGDAIAEGALQDRIGFEKVVDEAVRILAPSPKSQQEYAEIRLAVANGEYNEQYADYLVDDERGYVAREFLEAYVRCLRKEKAWQLLVDHRHLDAIRPIWLRAISGDGSVSTEELAAAVQVAYQSLDEVGLWYLLLRAWDDRYLTKLTERVINGHSDAIISVAALICLAEKAPAQVASISNQLIAGGAESRLLEIALQLGELRRGQNSFDAVDHSDAAVAAIKLLPPAYRIVGDAAYAVAVDEVPSIGDDTCRLVDEHAGSSEELHLFRLRLSKHASLAVGDDIRWLLSNARESSSAVEAIRAASALGMTGDVEAALGHRFAHVVAHALTAIADGLAPPLPGHLLELAKAKGSPIRMALVELLVRKPHLAHLKTLLVLVQDKWSPETVSYGEEGDYPIARKTVAAIASLSPLESGVVDELLPIALDATTAEIQRDLLSLLVSAGGPYAQKKMLQLAISSDKQDVAEVASLALLLNCERIGQELFAEVKTDVLNAGSETVAFHLCLTLAGSGALNDIMSMAALLATNRQRHVFLIVVVMILTERDMGAATRVAELLPSSHPAKDWALGRRSDALQEGMLDDLGDPLCVDLVVRYVEALKSQ